MNIKNIRVTSALEAEIYKRILKRKHKRKFGCSCMFVPLNKHSGIKIYCSEQEQKIAWKNQKKLCKSSLSPEVGNKFTLDFCSIYNDITIKYGRKSLYGYFTQVADPPGKVYSEEKKNLIKEINNLGFMKDDLCVRNFGRVKGKLVTVDTDMWSLNKTGNRWS